MRSCFNNFKSDVSLISLPEKFTFPFHYEPHPIALVAVKELQNYLLSDRIINHNFGLNPNKEGLVIGKMFGVLVVRNEKNQLGFLAAFSGKLAESNHHEGFVPPIYDMLVRNSFFRKEEEILNTINRRIEDIESSKAYLESKLKYFKEKERSDFLLSEDRKKLKKEKQDRKIRRVEAETRLSKADFEIEKEKLKIESLQQQFVYKEYYQYLNQSLDDLRKEYEVYQVEINDLREDRKLRSGALQKKLFDKYQFFNAKGELQSLSEIFRETVLKIPPAGAGECAAPKLIQFAYKQKLKPIALAEFWWGVSPNAELRRHKYFYPACIGKCQPILTHMLKGLKVDENPILKNPAKGKVLEIVYEDDAIVIVNKPAELLSVPGRNIKDSVQSRMKERYPNATGPLLVHRLDMSTSGILLVAKRKEYHQCLQGQFIKRLVNKRYVALLQGVVLGNEGEIKLPLKGDFLDRPRQMVCLKKGKSARTKWKKINENNGRTRMYFYPRSGRTHQLRVHAAHKDGLNAPIVGDDLYGIKSDRLHLHAEFIEFQHPKTGQMVSFQVESDF